MGGSVHITPLNNGVHFVLCIGVNLIAFIACFSATVSLEFECQHLISFPGPQYGIGGLGMRPVSIYTCGHSQEIVFCDNNDISSCADCAEH